ncbi:hypothetical protein GCM10009785_22280 [Brooklawnia cerclae]
MPGDEVFGGRIHVAVGGGENQIFVMRGSRGRVVNSVHGSPCGVSMAGYGRANLAAGSPGTEPCLAMGGVSGASGPQRQSDQCCSSNLDFPLGGESWWWL